MHSFELQPFHPTKDLKIVASSELNQRELLVFFCLEGALETVELPDVTAAHLGQFTEELYKETCMEVFLGNESEQYQEWNFSFDGRWWCCDYSSYRQSHKTRYDLLPKSIESFYKPDQKVLRVKIPIEDAYSRIGFNSVVKKVENSGPKEGSVERSKEASFWALRHTGKDKPDFHVKENRAISLEDLLV